MAARQVVNVAMLLVGTTGFEPATSRTPSVRATRLRHVPSNSFQYRRKTFFVKRAESLRLFLRTQGFSCLVALLDQIQDLAQLNRDLLERSSLLSRKRSGWSCGRWR